MAQVYTIALNLSSFYLVHSVFAPDEHQEVLFGNTAENVHKNGVGAGAERQKREEVLGWGSIQKRGHQERRGQRFGYNVKIG